MRYLILVGLLALMLLVACAKNDSTLTASKSRFGHRPSSDVSYLGQEFRPALGPIRGDLLAVDLLGSTGLTLNDTVVSQNLGGNPVLTVPGVPLDKGFFVRYHEPDRPVRNSNSTYPICQSGSGAYVYTAVGAALPPPPLGPATPSAAYPGDPIPTPVPTPSSGPFPVDLTADGLLNAKWPKIILELSEPVYNGVRYRFTSYTYIDQRGSDASISPDLLEELEVLSMVYRVSVDLPPPLASLVIGDPVTDRVRVLRLKDRPASEIIIVDQCPLDFQGDQFLFYSAKEPK